MSEKRVGRQIPGGKTKTLFGTTPFLGDAIKFSKCPLEFISKRVLKFKSETFSSDLLGRKTFFVTTWKDVLQLMKNGDDDFFHEGYSEFITEAHFGSCPNLLALPRNSPERDIWTKTILSDFKISESILNTIFEQHICEEWIPNKHLPNVYESSKVLARHILASVLLPRNLRDDEYETIETLLKTHFRGITSTLPIKLNLFGLFKTKTQEGFEAGEELKNVFRQHILKFLEERNAEKNHDDHCHHHHVHDNDNEKNIFDKIVCEISDGKISIESGVTHLMLFNFLSQQRPWLHCSQTSS